MSKLVVRIGARLRAMPVVVLAVYMAWIGIFVVAAKLSVEDYYSSVFGYNLMPFNQVDSGTGWWVGFLPQLMQLSFGLWALERRHRIASIVAGASFIADFITDVHFKTVGVPGNPWVLYPAAVFVTFFLFTIGSEFLVLMAAQNIYEYSKDAWTALGTIGGGAWGHITKWLRGTGRKAATAGKNGMEWALGGEPEPQYAQQGGRQPRQARNIGNAAAQDQMGFGDVLGGDEIDPFDQRDMTVAERHGYGRERGQKRR